MLIRLGRRTDQKDKIMRLVRVRFDLCPRSELPEGRLSEVIERPLTADDGEAIFRLCDEEATPQIVDELTRKHVHIIGGGLWVGERDEQGAPLPPTQGAKKRRRITEARYEIVPASQAHVLHGEICSSYEKDGVWVWMVLEPHITPALRDDMNIEMTRAVENDLWIREPDEQD